MPERRPYCALVGMLIALAAFFAVPPRYSSQKVFPVITTDTTANGLNSEGAPNAFSQEFLGSIIQKRNLYPRERSHMPLDNVVGELVGSRNKIIPLEVSVTNGSKSVST